MAWGDDKNTATDPDNPGPAEQLTAEEWTNHVDEGHFPPDQMRLGTESGDPVLTDPQNGGQVVARYDRATGSWVVESIQAAAAQITHLPNDGLSSWSNKKRAGMRETPTPRFERVDSNPKLTAADVDWSSSSVADPTGVNFPSVLPTDKLPNPNGDYYCYFAPHDTNGTGVAWFNNPEDSWTPKGSPAIDSSNSGEPGPMYDPSTNEIWLYSSRPNRSIRLFRSADGVSSFTEDSQSPVFTVSSQTFDAHAGYNRPIRTERGVYLAGWQKSQEGLAQTTVKFSPDGKTNWRVMPVHADPMSYPTGDSSRPVVNLNLCPWMNGYLAVWNRPTATGSSDIHIGFTTDGVHVVDWGVALEGGGPSAQSWESDHVAAADLFWHKADLYMAYHSRQTGGRKIGVAKADFSEVKA